jgi:hypothetical protein
MKITNTLLCLLILVDKPSFSEQLNTIDLGKDNPHTLIKTRSTNFIIQGFHLGITHGQAWQIIEENSLFLGERPDANPSRQAFVDY